MHRFACSLILCLSAIDLLSKGTSSYQNPHNLVDKIVPDGAIQARHLYLRGGRRQPDLEQLRKKSEDFWLPIIDRLNNNTAVWEPFLREIIDLESTGSWNRIEPGEPEIDDDDPDVYTFLGKSPPDENPFGSARFSSRTRGTSMYTQQSLEAQELAKRMGTSGSNVTDGDLRWWNLLDQQELDRQDVMAFLEETVCEGQGPYSGAGQRFGGKPYRNRAMYLHDNETDEQMIARHFYAEKTNETAALLHRLEVAASYDDFQEIENLVLNHSVDVNGLIDTLGHERAIHFAAWHDRPAAVRKLILLGADPNARNYYNQTAAHRAACNGALGVLQDLIDAGADPMAVDAYNFTPGTWAAVTNQNQTCQWLYARFVHDSGARGGDAWSPLGPPPHYGLPENAGCHYFSVAEDKDKPPPPEYRLFHDMLLQDGEAEWAEPPTDAELMDQVTYKAWENEKLRVQEERACARDEELASERAARQEDLRARRRQMILGPDA